MFGFLKDKLKKAVGKFSKDVEKEAVVEKKEVLERKPEAVTDIKEEKKDKGFFHKIFGKKEEKPTTESKEVAEEKKETVKEIVVEKKESAKEIKEEKKEILKEAKPEIRKEHVKEQTIHKEPVREEIKPLIKEHKEHLEHHSIEQKHEEVSKPVIAVKEEPKILHKEFHKAEEHKHPFKEVPVIKEEAEKKGFFSKITETFTKFHLSEEKFEELFWELEVVLLENNVAVEVIDKIKNDMKKELLSDKISRKGVEDLILDTLRKSISELFDVESINLLDRIKHKKEKPYIITIIGVNGSGKTTSIAKLTHKFQNSGLNVVLAASDTFRAAAIQQLEEHANRLKTKIIKHDYHSDPAAVAFDAIKYAKAHDVDVVIIDTAGRLHSNTNLMEELKKVVRVCKPDIKIFVGESITGNDCVEQAKEFDKAVGIDAIILAKADVDEKGGAAISVSYVTQKPILYLGTGQTYDDLKDFDSRLIIESLEL